MENTVAKLRAITMSAHEFIEKLHEDSLALSVAQHDPALASVITHLTTLEGIRMSIFVRDDQPDTAHYFVGNRNTEEIYITNSIPLTEIDDHYILELYRKHIMKNTTA
ncbi:hypothetical protein [Vibrio parahaemolyticus]|uniref:hypothetical protein n=1 Tax=Vibrio parahaemolyticus TaxID=670 RepID=UPI00084BA07E|nr:hypothetical protein [Vibrio parahaemolyticus]ODY73161.1 hypothetical protein BBM29_19140 [Vibrio parahaemolyticus]HCE2186057.1 hypothetical protein [Vibrio parahaemolyticus]